ncbi:MAG TPA: ATP-grasp domain-containing protein [Gemmatimonadales bacterium]|nr:ATP-grasp domain-containing protein [Gemmatimonadales bacterium]
MAAAKDAGVDLTIASDHRSTVEALQPELLLALDFDHPEQAAQQVASFASRTPVHAVLGTDDDSALVAAHAARLLGLPSNAPEAALAARDKYRQRLILSRNGAAVPAFALHRFDDDLPERARHAPYPCVLKPTCLAGSRGVIRADNPDQFLEAAERIRRILRQSDVAPRAGEASGVFLVERYVEGREFALEGLLVGGQLRVLALFDKPDPLVGPCFEETIYVTPSRAAPADQAAIAAAVQRGCTALGLASGPVHAEVRLGAGTAWIIEIAARPIGGRCADVLRFGEHGATTLEAILVRHACSLSLPALERERAAAAVMMIPVPAEGVLERVEGVEAARQVEYLEDVQLTIPPGQRLVPLPEGGRYPGFLFARAPDPERAEAAVREAHRRLRFVVTEAAAT